MFNRRNLLKLAVASSFLSVNQALASEGKKGESKPIESNFILPTQVTGTIMSGFRAVGIMQADIGVYTVDANLKMRLNLIKPVLQSRWRAALQEYLNNYYNYGEVPDAVVLSTLLQRALLQFTGKSRARVLIQGLIAR